VGVHTKGSTPKRMEINIDLFIALMIGILSGFTVYLLTSFSEPLLEYLKIKKGTQKHLWINIFLVLIFLLSLFFSLFYYKSSNSTSNSSRLFLSSLIKPSLSNSNFLNSFSRRIFS